MCLRECSPGYWPRTTRISEAAIIGVYHHGLAGDLAAGKMGETSLVAGDLVEFLGQSFGH